MRALVTGAGGFIGGHLVGRLLEEGHEVRAVDRKPEMQWHQQHPDAVNIGRADVGSWRVANHVAGDRKPVHGEMSAVDAVYHLAADMGGMGFIETHKAQCMLSVLSSTHMLMAADNVGARFFYASSACVYAAEHQTDPNVTALREEDAYPAMPEDGYGWEKLFSERMCRHFTEDFGLSTRVARYHNVYGTHGTYDGGREKAPAAVIRKVIEAKLSGRHEIEIWGDGHQSRSFMFIDDCIEGTLRIMESNVADPLNLGSSELVTINQLVDIVEAIAGVELERRYALDAPQGVRGRNSDNARIQAELGWQPSTPLVDGLERTFAWIYDQMANR